MKIAFVDATLHNVVSRGAGYIAGSIQSAGINIDFYNLIYLSVKQIANKVIKNNYDILLISSMTLSFPKALDIIRTVKKIRKIPVLLGGVHATLVGSKLLEDHEEIDFLCIGEGESMVLEFLNNFEKGGYNSIRNLVFRDENNVITNPIREAENLAELPDFPWHLFTRDAIIDGEGFINIASSRGCPYNCTYCSNTVYLQKYGKSYLRNRPVKDVIEEIRFLLDKYKPKGFFFGDEMLMSDFSRAEELLTVFKKVFNLPYGCMLRVEHVTKECVDLLKETGCMYVGAGVECGNEVFRKKYLYRNMSNEQIISAFRLLKTANIKTASFNIIGFPFENDDSITEETIALNKLISPDYFQVSVFFPFPGTKLYERCVEMDLIDNNKVREQVDYYSDSVLRNRSLIKKKNEIEILFNPQRQTLSRKIRMFVKKIVFSAKFRLYKFYLFNFK